MPNRYEGATAAGKGSAKTHPLAHRSGHVRRSVQLKTYLPVSVGFVNVGASTAQLPSGADADAPRGMSAAPAPAPRKLPSARRRRDSADSTAAGRATKGGALAFAVNNTAHETQSTCELTWRGTSGCVSTVVHWQCDNKRRRRLGSPHPAHTQWGDAISV